MVLRIKKTVESFDHQKRKKYEKIIKNLNLAKHEEFYYCFIRLKPFFSPKNETAAKKERKQKEVVEVTELALTSSPSYVSCFFTILSENYLISSENQYWSLFYQFCFLQSFRLPFYRNGKYRNVEIIKKLYDLKNVFERRWGQKG